jgi:hypothetical protein
MTITVELSSYIKIMDISGRELYASIVEAGTSIISTAHLSTGVYFISITNDRGTTIKRLEKD